MKKRLMCLFILLLLFLCTVPVCHAATQAAASAPLVKSASSSYSPYDSTLYEEYMRQRRQAKEEDDSGISSLLKIPLQILMYFLMCWIVKMLYKFILGIIHFPKRVKHRSIWLSCRQPIQQLTEFSEEKFVEAFPAMFTQFMEGLTSGRMALLNPLLTAELYTQIDQAIQAAKSKQSVYRRTYHMLESSVTDVKLLGCCPHRFRGPDYLRVSFQGSFAYERFKDGEEAGLEKNRHTICQQYTWLLTRHLGPRSEQISNCPNCNAAIDVNNASACPYCGAKITSADYRWVIFSIESSPLPAENNSAS